MFAFVTLALFALPLLSAAQLVPTAPGPGDTFKQGSPCSISWTADTSGKWKNTFIELMTGPNNPMTHLSTVANVDGTDPTKTSISIPCPAVSPAAPIYFYQFTAQGQPATWTGRFTISDPTGATSPAPNATQPDGAAIPWGNGKLANPGTPPPPTAPSGQVDASNSGPASASSLAQPSAFAAPSSAAASISLLTSASPAASSVAAPAPTSNSGVSVSSAPATTSALSAGISSPSAAAATAASTTSGAAITSSLSAALALVAAAILGLVSLY